MTNNKKKLRQQHNLRLVFELCGSLTLPCHVALSPEGSAHTEQRLYAIKTAHRRRCYVQKISYSDKVI
mgnify:FL=1